MSRATPDKSVPSRGRKPLRHDNGKGDRRTPEQLARQERVFALNTLHSKTVREIAALVGVNKETVMADIRHESARRQAENESRRDSEITRAIATYEAFIAKAIENGSAHALDSAIQARARLDKILGLEAPTKIDLGLQTLIDAIEPK